MAISILQYPASCSLAQSPIVFSVSESSAANTSASFQYNADLYYWTGTTSDSASNPNYTLVKYPNSSNVGIFDFSRIVNSTLTDLREENPSNVVYFKGDFYFQYRSGSAYATGSKVSSGVYKALDGYSLFQEPIGQQITSKSLYWPLMTDGPATQSIFGNNKGEIGVYTGTGCNLGVSHLQYSSSLTSSYVEVSSSISSSEQIQQAPSFPSQSEFPITYNGWYTICPVSSSVSSSISTVYTEVSASFDSDVVSGGDIDFDYDGTTLQTNASAFDTFFTSQVPQLWVYAQDGVSTYFASGSGAVPVTYAPVFSVVSPNIKFQAGYKIDNAYNGQVLNLFFSPTEDYRYPGIFSSGSFVTVNTDVYDEVGNCLYFEEICEQKYPNIRIKWKNRYGQFDYHNFYLVNKQSFTTTNRSYQPQLGTWEGNTLGYNNYDSSKLNYIVDSQQSLTVNTGYVDEAYNEIFKQLLVSEEIYWVYDEDNDDLRPITINTPSITFKTGVNDKLIQYSFDFTWGQGYKLIV